MAGYRTPTIPGAHVMTRIYNSPLSSTTNGAELATGGIVSKYKGLVIGWLQ